MDIRQCDASVLLESLENNSVDLILTDPPYVISRESGMDKLHQTIENSNGQSIHTEEEWEEYRLQQSREFTDAEKNNWIMYGTILGKKYAVKTDYGKWDKEFSIEKLEEVLRLGYKKLRKGGTIIVWFDLWKLTTLSTILEKCKFKQLRFIEWIKTNPQPRNSSKNYLTNCREMALLAVKGGSPTFNSKYDNGIYEYPIMGGKRKMHPTQKNLELFKEIIRKHSNEGDLVCDVFLGSGTTARACFETGRKFIGCELEDEYYKHSTEWSTSTS